MASVAAKIFQGGGKVCFTYITWGDCTQRSEGGGGDSATDSCLLGCLGYRFMKLNEVVYLCSFTRRGYLSSVLHRRVIVP